MWGFLLVLCVAGLVGIAVLKRMHKASLIQKRITLIKDRNMTEENADAAVDAMEFPVPTAASVGLAGLTVFFAALFAFNLNFFYAEPAYVYHVRTILGQEKVVNKTGYALHLIGRVTPWKKAMTVQSVEWVDNDGDGNPDAVSSTESDDNKSSASLPALTVVMLDQVDAKLSATARFRIPLDEESFFTMAHEYRTPENLLRAALIPAFKETLQATGSLMGAEEYYAGRRTEFNADFENQMQNGVYLVSRQQVEVQIAGGPAVASADASKATQAPYGTDKKIKWVVKKKRNQDGSFVRNQQKFIDYGINVVEARVTNLVPNEKFVDRMQLKQQASADRAIAQEKRVQEQEQRLLAIATGEREVAEEQAKAKKTQIKSTTDAETAKRLVLIKASQQLEQAEIDKQTAQITKEKADIDAERIVVLAKADEEARKAKIAGDNALQQKLDAEVAIQKVWADAYSKRAVPQYVFGASGGTTPTGGDSEAATFMKLMTMQAAEALNYKRNVDSK